MTWKRCTVCSHGSQVAIEKKLREGASMELIAERYGLTDDQLRRHRDEHMNALVPAGKQGTVIESPNMDGASMFAEHQICIAECKELIEWSRAHEDPRGWALGIREWRGCLDQQNRILGLYDQVDPRIGRLHSRRIIEVVSRALEKFPEAQQQVLLAIDQVEKEDE